MLVFLLSVVLGRTEDGHVPTCLLLLYDGPEVGP